MRLFEAMPVADRGVDVVAEDGLAGRDVAGEQCVDALAQKRVAKGPVATHARGLG
jgi:hypothetical protein